MNRSLLIVALLPLITGCNVLRPLLGVKDTPAPTPPLVRGNSPVVKGQIAPTIFHTFITDGQSNMYGAKQGPAFPLNDHVQGRPLGPGYQFAVDYVNAHPGSYARTVNCSEGGTSIDVHQEGASNFETCISNVAASMGPGDTLEGILFWQGEADGIAGMSGAEWANKFTLYINAMRRRLNKPTLPVLFVQIGQNLTVSDGLTNPIPTWDDIKQVQASFFMPRVLMVRSDDLTLADSLHYDTASNAVVGHRLYGAFESL